MFLQNYYRGRRKFCHVLELIDDNGALIKRNEILRKMKNAVPNEIDHKKFLFVVFIKDLTHKDLTKTAMSDFVTLAKEWGATVLQLPPLLERINLDLPGSKVFHDNLVEFQKVLLDTTIVNNLAPTNLKRFVCQTKINVFFVHGKMVRMTTAGGRDGRHLNLHCLFNCERIRSIFGFQHNNHGPARKGGCAETCISVYDSISSNLGVLSYNLSNYGFKYYQAVSRFTVDLYLDGSHFKINISDIDTFRGQPDFFGSRHDNHRELDCSVPIATSIAQFIYANVLPIDEK